MSISRAAFVLVLLAFAATLGACKRAPPLAPELQAIKCPANQPAHAVGKFVNAQVTFVCIKKELASKPDLLRCDLTSRPMICEDDGSLMFSRDKDGNVYSGPLPVDPKRNEDSRELSPGSQLILNFRAGPPRTTTFEPVETQWKFLLAGGKDLLPPGFTFVKGTLCDRGATVLNRGICNLEARSASLYWHIAVEIHAAKGTEISPEDYREALAFWMKLIDKLVVDPAK